MTSPLSAAVLEPASLPSAATTTRSAPAPGPGKYDRRLSSDERRQAQRTRLLAAAAHVFAEQGFANASVDLIIRRVSMSRRTFYEHFVDLHDALVKVYDYGTDLTLEYVERALGDHEQPLDKLEAGVAAYLETINRNRHLARVLHNEIRAAGPQHAKRHEQTLRRFVNLLTREFQDAVAKYELDFEFTTPDDHALFGLTAAIEATVMSYLNDDRELDRGEAMPRLLRLILAPFALPCGAVDGMRGNLARLEHHCAAE